MSWGAAFESGHYRGRALDGHPIDYHQLEATRHAEHLEEDYRIAREEFGVSAFRDGAWLARLVDARGRADWSYLDRLAAVSRGQTELAVCHYEWPWLTSLRDLDSGYVIEDLARIAGEIARRYPGAFASYCPIVEMGHWHHKMARERLWWPAENSPRHLWPLVTQCFRAMAHAVRMHDASAAVTASEPWNAWPDGPSLDELQAAFDEVAHVVDIVGLNIYGMQPTPPWQLLVEARRRFPDKRLVVSETSHGFEADRFTAGQWLGIMDHAIRYANDHGARVERGYWAPFVDLVGDHGRPLPGGLVRHDRTWDAGVAEMLRSAA